MQTEVLLPLIAYLLLVFGLSVYAYTRRQAGNFLTEYFLGNRSMGGFVSRRRPTLPEHRCIGCRR